MGILARARPAELEAACTALGPLPAWTWLRRPETGLVMVRGRAGGSGEQFNLGEMTVTRCALALDSGTTGVSYVQGRDVHHAERAALLDAILQDPLRQKNILGLVIEPLARAHRERAEVASRKAAATQVEFYTLARGDDA